MTSRHAVEVYQLMSVSKSPFFYPLVQPFMFPTGVCDWYTDFNTVRYRYYKLLNFNLCRI